MRRQGKQASAADTDLQEEADRPSEWTGFIYNPYSGDLLPPEGDEDEDDDEGGVGQDRGDVGAAYGGRRCFALMVTDHALVDNYPASHDWL